MEINTIYNMDALAGLKLMADNSIDCCVTSPPYWGLRDYGVEGRIGLEKTPEEYVTKMVEVFREVRRVLKPEGTLWINIGDTYMASPNMGEDDKKNKMGRKRIDGPSRHNILGLKKKDLVGIPWMVAFALRADGWYLRQDIIWSKPNPMPESVTDRCTKSHEYIFLVSKSSGYYFDADAISEPVADSTVARMKQNISGQSGSDRVPGKNNGTMKAVLSTRYGGDKYTADPSVFNRTKSGNIYEYKERRNKRSVWTVSTKPFKEAHFATFPEKLIEPCILAGCPEEGIVLDPFMGSGTTAKVAYEHRRNYIGFELNPDYIKISEKRLNGTMQRLWG